MTRTYRVISGFSRLDLPPERWTGRVPAKWRDRVPHSVGAGDTVIIEHRSPPRMGQTWVDPDPYGERWFGPNVYDLPGTGSPDQRLREQEQGGVDAEILYTNPHAPVFLEMVASQDRVSAETMWTHPVFTGFWRGVRQDEGYKVLVHAYNEFLAQEYCAANRSRLIAAGVIPDTGVGDAIAEMRHCAGAGLKGVALHRFPSGKGYPTPEDDSFWRAALELNMPISFLTSGTTGPVTTPEPLSYDPHRPGDWVRAQERARPPLRPTGSRPIPPLQLACTGVYDRFPQLRLYWAEPPAGWPHLSPAQNEDCQEQTRYWRDRSSGIAPMAQPLSFYLKAHCFWGFQHDPEAVRWRHKIGADRLIWGSGFGMATRSWSNSRWVIEACFADVPEDERYRMLAGNVIEFFHLKDEVLDLNDEVVHFTPPAAAAARAA